MSCFLCQNVKALKSKYIKSNIELRSVLQCGRFTLLNVVLRARLFFPFKLWPWQLRAMKQLRKRSVLVNVYMHKECLSTLPQLEKHIIFFSGGSFLSYYLSFQLDGCSSTELSYNGMECFYGCLSMCVFHGSSSKKACYLLIYVEGFCKDNTEQGVKNIRR